MRALFNRFMGKPVTHNGPYSYIPGPRDLGIGVGNMALVQPRETFQMDFYAPGYNIKKTFDILQGGFAGGNPSYPEADLRGNGVYLPGDIALQSLVELENKGNDK